ncbi:MAG: hypothetical protein JWS12_617 [Candidatus Saccharibacteria bacterium]|nr:hypothetical protein [Candidatus Saccharibacteria bacterium]
MSITLLWMVLAAVAGFGLFAVALWLKRQGVNPVLAHVAVAFSVLAIGCVLYIQGFFNQDRASLYTMAFVAGALTCETCAWKRQRAGSQ